MRFIGWRRFDSSTEGPPDDHMVVKYLVDIIIIGGSGILRSL